LFGFLDFVAPAVEEIALPPAGLKIENYFLKEKQSKTMIFFLVVEPFQSQLSLKSAVLILCRT